MDMVGLLLWNSGIFSYIAEHLKAHKKFWGDVSFEGKHSASNANT